MWCCRRFKRIPPPTPPHPTPPHTVSVCLSYVARSGVSSVGGSLSSGFGLTLSVSRGTDHLRVVNVAPSTVVSVASALSPGSLLFPFSDSGFASFCCFLFSYSFFTSSSFLFLVFGLFFACLGLFSLFSSSSFSSSYYSRFSFSCGSFFLFSLLFLGFGLSSSSSSPWFSSSSSFSLTSSSLFLFALCLLGSFVLFFSSSFLCFLFGRPGCLSCRFLLFLFGLRFVSGFGFGFVSGLSVFSVLVFSVWGFGFSCVSFFFLPSPSKASRDFASGSSVFFSVHRSIASSVPLPSVSSSALPPQSSSAAFPFSQSSAPLPLAPFFSAPSSIFLPSSLGSLSAPQVWGVSALGSASVVSSASPGFPPLSAPSSLFSGPPPRVSSTSSLPPAAPVLAPPSSSLFSSAPPAFLDSWLRVWALLRRFLWFLCWLQVLSLPSSALSRFLTLLCSPLRPLRLR